MARWRPGSGWSQNYFRCDCFATVFATQSRSGAHSVMQHITIRAGRPQRRAHFCGFDPGVSADSDPRGAHVAYDPAYDDVRLALANNCHILRLPFTVADAGITA